MTVLPTDLQLYSAPVSNADGSITVSLRFAMSPAEFEFARTNGIIPEDTSQILDIVPFELPALHDLHLAPTPMQ